MKKNLFALAVLAGLILLLWAPETVLAGSAVLDPPPPVSRERIIPPDISGVNPDVTLSEGHEGEIPPSGRVMPAGFSVPAPAVEAPPYQELEPASREDVSGLDWTYSLAVPFRTQVGQNGCGAAALGMALDALEHAGGEKAPETSALIAQLQNSGLLYKNGTGVEELAALARSAGCPGSQSFQGWTLEQLAGELADGHPVLVSLGLNGEGQPGHFVTLSGITGDGQFVRCLDPARGEVVVSAEDFLSQWERQGASGLSLSTDPLPPGEDPLAPWLGLFGALSMLMVLVQNPQVGEEAREILERIQGWLSRSDRPGLGGSLTPGSGSGGGSTVRVPRYETRLVRKGWKTVEKQVPVFETRRIQVRSREVKKQVPVYTDRKVQVGTRTVTRQVPRYVTKRIRIGTRTVKKKVKVTKYKKKVRYSWKKVTKKVPVYRKYGWYRVRVGTKNVTRWKRVRQVRRVPYTTWKTVRKQVPVYKDVRVRQGNRTVSEQVPVYAWKKVRTGTRTVTVTEPVYEDRKVQVGTRAVTERVPNFERERVQVGWQEVPVLEGGGEEGKIAAAVLKERGDAVSGSGGEGEIAAAVLKERGDAVSGSGGEGESGAPPPWDDEMKRAGDFSRISTGYEPAESIRYQELYQEMLYLYQTNHCDWNGIIQNKENNPISIHDMPGEWQMVAIANSNNVVIKKFISNLDLDEQNISNYEPIYISQLKEEYIREYNAAENWYIDLWKDKSKDWLLREAFELDKDNQISELLDCIANGYEYTSEH